MGQKQKNIAKAIHKRNRKPELNTAETKDTEHSIYRGASKTNYLQLETRDPIERAKGDGKLSTVQCKTNNNPEECPLVAVKAYPLLAVTLMKD